MEAENSTSATEVGLEQSHLIWQVKPADHAFYHQGVIDSD